MQLHWLKGRPWRANNASWLISYFDILQRSNYHIFTATLHNQMNFTSPEHLHLLQFVVPHKTGTPLLMSPE